MSEHWEVLAVKYADRNSRVRADSFIFDDNHDAPHAMDYFVWVIRNDMRTILVDTGYDTAESQLRDRPIIRDPANALAEIGIVANSIDTVIVTHLHYDHAGGLACFPNATLHLQRSEMVFATGPCMCHDVLRMPYSTEHVCEAVRRLYAGKLIYHDGDGEVAKGVTVHRIGGHSRGLQCVRVRTVAGWLCLASDAAHYYENLELRKPFPIVVDLEDMLEGFKTVERLASRPELIIPGHDPLVTTRYPAYQSCPFIWRLDQGQIR